MTIKFAIITCSDTRTLETDEAGQKLEQLIAEQGWECVRRVVEMDERPFIAGALIDACDNTDADIVLTCGGSGLSLRDVTPEATRDVADREVPGIAEAMRAHSVAITPVSYTHLDVYKRQLFICTLKIVGSFVLLFMINGPLTAIMPVSYTHLSTTP